MLVANRNIIDNTVYFLLYGVFSIFIIIVPHNVLVLNKVFRVSSSFSIKVKPSNLYIVQVVVDTV